MPAGRLQNYLNIIQHQIHSKIEMSEVVIQEYSHEKLGLELGETE